MNDITARIFTQSADEADAHHREVTERALFAAVNEAGFARGYETGEDDPTFYRPETGARFVLQTIADRFGYRVENTLAPHTWRLISPDEDEEEPYTQALQARLDPEDRPGEDEPEGDELGYNKLDDDQSDLDYEPYPEEEDARWGYAQD
jgi:hypothetical protein